MAQNLTNTNTLSLAEVTRALPPRLKASATQDLVDKLNNIKDNNIIAETIRNNFISYTGVLSEGKFKTEDYLNAVMYVSYKLMGHTNKDAYFKTFPKRYASLLAAGCTEKEISSYVTAYNKGKLVNLILEQTLVPTWVLNQDIYQKAINTQAELMMCAKSEKVRAMAADSILNHLAKPKEAGPLINIDMRENSGLNELKDALIDLAKTQQKAIKDGVSPKTIAEQRIIKDVESID